MIYDQGRHHQICRSWVANYINLNLSNYLSASDRIHLEYEILCHLSHEKVKLADYLGIIQIEHVCVYRLSIIIGHIIIVEKKKRITNYYLAINL